MDAEQSINQHGGTSLLPEVIIFIQKYILHTTMSFVLVRYPFYLEPVHYCFSDVACLLWPRENRDSLPFTWYIYMTDMDISCSELSGDESGLVQEHRS